MRAELAERARALDRADSLKSFRGRFHIPNHSDGSEMVYLVGNSLGLQPKPVESVIALELEKWRRLGVAAHFEGDEPWLKAHERVRGPLARLVGALPHEVVAMNSLTVNLHLMMATFFQPTGERSQLVMEANAFPSDQYAVATKLQSHGLEPADCLILLSPRTGADVLRTEDIVSAIRAHAEKIALILLGGLNYYTGQVLDIGAISRVANDLGIPIGFDLAHAVGNVPLRLHEWGCDFAVWCGYKYLNGGPGAVAGAFIHERHARDRSKPRLAGWWGNDPSTRFEMRPEFEPSDSADGWQISGPPILQLAALRASLAVFEEAGFDAIFEKGRRLNGFMREVLDDVGGPFRIITPREPGSFGCQLSLLFERNGSAACKALESNGVACDYREPDVIRVAAVPLYNSFSDVVRFGAILQNMNE